MSQPEPNPPIIIIIGPHPHAATSASLTQEQIAAILRAAADATDAS